MKYLNRLIIPIVVLGFLVLSACGGGDDPLPETERVKKILTSGSWNIQTVTVSGTTQTNQFTGLTLTFTATSYTTTNGKVVWPANGSWEFIDDTATTLLRSDGLEISIDEITNNQLKLSLPWQGSIGPGRISSLSGQHQFTFTKN